MFVAGYPLKVALQSFVQRCFYLIIVSLCLFRIKTPQLARHQSPGGCFEKGKTSEIKIPISLFSVDLF